MVANLSPKEMEKMKKDQGTSNRKFKFVESKLNKKKKKILKIPWEIGDKKVKIRSEIIGGPMIDRSWDYGKRGSNN